GEEINPGNKIKTTTPGSASINISAPGMDENKNKGRVAKRRTAASSDALTKTRARVIAATTGTDNDSADLTNNIAANKNEYSSAGKVKINIAPGTTDSSGEKTTTPDSNTIVKKDSLPPKKVIPPVPSEKEKEEKEKSWMLAAGLSVFHPLAVDGEPAVPYNRYGRKGGVADYIPAAYFRLYRTKKWFAHIEFRYGAPQSVKPFDYKQEIVDSNQQQLRSVFQLNKTYYHQVPLSFNYYVLPGLSVGAGVIYNHFVGAVSRQEVYVVATQDTLLSSTVVRDTEAGKYIKNHFQWSAEAQYQWRRLTLGARYSRDINPYIKYTDVLTGAALEKKAKAFNIFLRYELWRSKKWGGNR
ncbi:MAG: hypothetical protein H7Y86_17735, partial [Rhizobacter sp.]|nr:hypothetical protein [Ferruginibacter sp.]